ncbi:hypothetical protein C0416_04490 [bacterium]|nr:hypothetical protein [bacterium]
MSNPVRDLEVEEIAKGLGISLTVPDTPQHEPRQRFNVTRDGRRLGTIKSEALFFSKEELLQKLEGIIHK